MLLLLLVFNKCYILKQFLIYKRNCKGKTESPYTPRPLL